MGYAYLPDGSRIDYEDYIRDHPHWQAVRQARFEFDNHACGICHVPLDGQRFETHHLSYMHLGNERIVEVLTLCCKCHTKFHNNWKRQDYWRGKERGHWEVFSLEHTAKLCLAYYKEDKYLCKDMNAPNLCNKDIQRLYIDKYFKEFNITDNPMIDPNDLGLFVRNKRYELVFDAEARGLTVEQFLDEFYGPKIRGQNPLRTEAGRKGGTYDHSFTSFHSHYKENPNINILMEEVKKC